MQKNSEPKEVSVRLTECQEEPPYRKEIALTWHDGLLAFLALG
jgi:hypothetical protein